MFHKKNKLADFFKVQDQQIDTFAKRAKNHFAKSGADVSTFAIKQALFFLLDEINKAPTVAPTKNPVLRKYGEKILELSADGMGAVRIAKYLADFHKVKIGKSTIQTFINDRR